MLHLFLIDGLCVQDRLAASVRTACPALRNTPDSAVSYNKPNLVLENRFQPVKTNQKQLERTKLIKIIKARARGRIIIIIIHKTRKQTRIITNRVRDRIIIIMSRARVQTITIINRARDQTIIIIKRAKDLTIIINRARDRTRIIISKERE
jgi:hypothetical protein